MLMPLFGKPQLGQPRRPFDLSQQSGEQVDAVRSKIASLMDGVTEKNATPPAEPPAETTQPRVTEQRSAPVHTERWPATAGAPEQMSAAISNTPTEQVAVPQRNGSLEPQFDNSEMDQWPRRSSSTQDQRRQEETIPNERSRPSVQPEQPSWSLPPATYGDRAATDPLPPSASQAGTADRGHSAIMPADPVQEATASAVAREPQPAINIKGRAGGILIEIGKGQWPELMATLAERLAGAGNFFRNGAVALDLAARPLTEPELRQIHKMLIEQALELVLVRTASPETFQVALDMELAAQLESIEGQTTASAQPVLSNLANEHHFVYAGHLRAGQVLQRREHILIIGDVNPGATVISNGDILVWGHLRGVAQAGSSGDTRAVVAALNLVPVQLRISDFIAIAPEQKSKRSWGRQRSPVKQPEVAYLNGDRIVVEPWDATKFGGIAALRQ